MVRKQQEYKSLIVTKETYERLQTEKKKLNTNLNIKYSLNDVICFLLDECEPNGYIRR